MSAHWRGSVTAFSCSGLRWERKPDIYRDFLMRDKGDRPPIRKNLARSRRHLVDRGKRHALHAAEISHEGARLGLARKPRHYDRVQGILFDYLGGITARAQPPVELQRLVADAE